MKTISTQLVFFISVILNVVHGQKQEESIKSLIDSYSLTISSKPDSAFYYINKATEKSEKLKNTFLLSRCYYNLGYYYYKKNNMKRSEEYTKKAQFYSLKSNNYSILSLSYNQLGLVYRSQAKYNKALKNFQASFDIAEKEKNIKNQSVVLNNLGYLFELQKDTVKALDYYSKNKEIAYKNNLRFELLASYNNIAILKKNYDKELSIKYFKKALALAIELNDRYEEFNILINLSDVYLSYNDDSESLKGYKFLLKAEDVAKLLAEDDLMFYVYYNLGGYFQKKKDYGKTIFYYEKAINYFESGIPEDQKINLLRDIELVYFKMNDFKKAYFFKNKHSDLKDSIFNIKKNKIFNEIQTKYEVDKKNLKIQLLIKEKIINEDRKRLIFIISSLIIIALFLILLFLKNRVKTQKIISEKETEIHKREVIRLEQEKELNRIVGLVEGQDQERNRVAKEIHDGVGGALVGLKLELSQYNSELKSDVLNGIIKKIQKTFNELRLISHNLSLNTLKDNSLYELLINLKKEYEKSGELQVELQVFPANSIDKINETIKHQIYRVIQELLNNVSKHANTKTVFLNLTRHDDFLNIIIEDNGCGFDKVKTNGIGLRNIAERLSSIEAVFNIESMIGKGTTITIDIPISAL